MIEQPVLRAPGAGGVPGLVLRPWGEEDVPALLDAMRDPGMRRWLVTSLETPAEGLAWVADQRRTREAGTRFGFAVLESGPEAFGRGGAPARLVGNAVLKGLAPGKASAEVGYWTVADARGRGVAARALGALTDWAFAAFGDTGPRRLDLLHQAGNLASCRVAEKCGYALDGLLPAFPPDFPEQGHRHVRHHPGASAAGAGVEDRVDGADAPT
ncbi:GNAT family N-acetyltransferase [Streptomyces sp. NPDC097619]|uniref:GNAT family N-acetyltransferase n=1 Tax=Streptomyces sp. NPDC097619 TaxID=3157228 RepID=UPI00331ED1D0